MTESVTLTKYAFKTHLAEKREGVKTLRSQTAIYRKRKLKEESMSLYSTFYVEGQFGINRHILQRWIDSGFLKQISEVDNQEQFVEVDGEQGKFHLFTCEAVTRIILFNELVNFGISFRDASQIAYRISFEFDPISQQFGADFVFILRRGPKSQYEIREYSSIEGPIPEEFFLHNKMCLAVNLNEIREKVDSVIGLTWLEGFRSRLAP